MPESRIRRPRSWSLPFGFELEWEPCKTFGHKLQWTSSDLMVECKHCNRLWIPAEVKAFGWELPPLGEVQVRDMQRPDGEVFRVIGQPGSMLHKVKLVRDMFPGPDWRPR